MPRSEDDDYHAAVEWQLGTGLWYAAQVANRQGHGSAALQYANNADALLTSGGKTRSESPETAHHLGQLQFLTGSIYAIHQKDEATAVRWYDKALPHLQTTYPDSLLDERGLIGEQLVSVGISLWETGRRNTAVSVTEEGASLIAQAVQDGAAQKSALSVPYQNLAAMHRELGNTDEADRLADKAVEADPGAKNDEATLGGDRGGRSWPARTRIEVRPTNPSRVAVRRPDTYRTSSLVVETACTVHPRAAGRVVVAAGAGSQHERR